MYDRIGTSVIRHGDKIQSLAAALVRDAICWNAHTAHLKGLVTKLLPPVRMMHFIRAERQERLASRTALLVAGIATDNRIDVVHAAHGPHFFTRARMLGFTAS